MSTPSVAASTPGPGASLSAVSLSQSSVNSQGQPTGTVSLTAAAPGGGAIVTLASSNPGLVQVPASLTVPAGSMSANFTVGTSTTSTPSSATISASYGGTTRTTALSVLPPALTAVYSVSSPQKGADACVLGPDDSDQMDCVLDARGSTGFIDRWTWRYWTVEASPLGHTTTDSQTKPSLTNRCTFFQNSGTAIDAQGNRYIQMTVELVVQDRLGSRSGPVQRAIRMYPNRLCGYSF